MSVDLFDSLAFLGSLNRDRVAACTIYLGLLWLWLYRVGMGDSVSGGGGGGRFLNP